MSETVRIAHVIGKMVNGGISRFVAITDNK